MRMDAEERERLERMRLTAARYWRPAAAIVAAIVASLSGYYYFQNRAQERTEAAASAFFELRESRLRMIRIPPPTLIRACCRRARNRIGMSAHLPSPESVFNRAILTARLNRCGQFCKTSEDEGFRQSPACVWRR